MKGKRGNTSTIRGGHLTMYNLHITNEHLTKRINFQMRMKRKYLTIIKKMRKERQQLRNELRASDELASKLVANSNPKV
tara:strand:- start:731 stop:967 length:237 start_codon:yes stop_codon:yes gene_type:complete